MELLGVMNMIWWSCYLDVTIIAILDVYITLIVVKVQSSMRTGKKR